MSASATSATTPAEPLLTLQGIGLAFRGVTALEDVGFAVAAGEICGLIGPNGAGKSSLLNVLNGVYRPQAGRIRWQGQPLREMRPQLAARLGIARTFQNIALFSAMSVLDNVLTGRTLRQRATFLEHALRLPRATAEEARARADAEEVLAFLEIERHRDDPVGKLPYGLQKRVELARALSARPRLLLLDEPMAGMTIEEKHEMSRFVVDVNRRQGITVVLIEHDLGVVMDLCQHLVVLDHGRVIADGPTEEVRDDPRVIDAYLGAPHEAAA